MLTPLVDETHRAVVRSLAEPDLVRVAEALKRRLLDEECDRLVAALTTHNGFQAALNAKKEAVSADIAASAAGSFERLLLLRQAQKALPRIESQPVSDDVKRLFCEEFQYVATPPGRASFDVTKGSFAALCELTTLRRFPAGQFHWNVSGLPRSWVLKVKGRERLTLLYWIARKLKGFGPMFCAHLNANRKNWALTERQANRSYYRMAKSLERQPAVKGMMASSWFRSPDTFKVSPHMAWMNRTYLENGGLLVNMGPADPDCGVFVGSAERKRLYEAGEFTPTLGLVVWPREAMIDWALRHPELESQEPDRARAEPAPLEAAS